MSWRAVGSRQKARLIAYFERVLENGVVLPASVILQRAQAAIGLGTSQRASAYQLRQLKDSGLFYTYRSGRGRGGRLFIMSTAGRSRWRRRLREKGANPFYRGPTGYKKGNTAGPRHRLHPALAKLAWAIVKGRKPMRGFGQSWERNDPGWETLKAQHWDNCKVRYRPALLFNRVYQLLRARKCRREVVREYRELLHKWHGIATDQGIEMEPTGLAFEWGKSSDQRSVLQTF